MMDMLAELTALEARDSFVARHVAPSEGEIAGMLAVLGVASLGELANRTVPGAIRTQQAMDLPPAIDEAGAMAELRELAGRNVLKKSLIGQGYHGTHTPPVILRNVLENPGWYTAYTPYQAEIAQGRLEALLNFQTMVCDRQCLLAGRGDGGGRSRDDGPRAVQGLGRRGRGGGRLAPANAGGAGDAGQAAWA